MTLQFRPEDHTYWDNGLRVSGVTSILNDLNVYDEIPPNVLKKAAERGSRVHALTEDYDRGTVVDVGEEEEPYFTAWTTFLEDTKFEVKEIELRVYHDKLRFAGTLDRTGLFDGDLSVLDLKVVWAVNPATALQTAGYEYAYRYERKILNRLRRFSIQLCSTGKYVLKEYTDPTDLTTFLSQRTIYEWKLKHGIP